MAPLDPTQNSVLRWEHNRDKNHQHPEMDPAAQVTAHVRQAPRTHREPEPEPQPRRNVVLQPVYQPQCHRDYHLGLNPVLVGVYSAFRVRSGYRMVMGNRGSRRRKVAKAAAVVGGILVAKAVFRSLSSN